MKLWDKTSREEREKIFEKLGYAFPYMLSSRQWKNLTNHTKKEFKKAIKALKPK